MGSLLSIENISKLVSVPYIGFSGKEANDIR